jgi:hypothetical protein
MPYVGFEHTIPAFERAKTVHALDHTRTVIGIYPLNLSDIGVTFFAVMSSAFIPLARTSIPERSEGKAIPVIGRGGP